MTGDITQVPPTMAQIPPPRAGLSAAQVMTLLNGAQDVIPEGESAQAQVISLKQVDPQQFQMLLRVMLTNGSQTSLFVSSALPLPPGTLIQVAQASSSQLLLSLQQVNSALNNVVTELDTRQLPAGTLLQGKVMTSQAVDPLTGAPTPAAPAPGSGQATVYRSQVLLLNTPQAGTTLSIESPGPLALGSLLSARVQGSQTLSFVPLTASLDQLAVAQQLSTQQSRQGSLENLLTALQNLPRSQVAVTPALQASIDQLLADIPDIEQLASARNVAQAFSASGLFMEARLMAGQNLQQLPDLKANLMRLIAQLLPGLPANTSYGAAAAANTLARVMPSAIRNALGTLGQLAARGVPQNFPLPERDVANGAEKDDLEMLLKLAAAAVSRLQSHQLGGLEQTRSTADGAQVTTWQLEVPMRNAHEFVPLQVKVQREEPAQEEQTASPEQDRPRHREQLWSIDLAFDLEPLGPLQVHARLVRGTLSSQLWAERESCATLIEHELDYLRERLVACGLSVGELSCTHGTAPQGRRTHVEHRWIDENA